MEKNRENCYEIAKQIYQLDKGVYECVGSSLGRTFTGDEATCVEEITRLLITRPQGHEIRSDIALIGNMARTIVMGRCADVVLTNHRIPHISIFITASFEQRVRRMMELHNLNYKQAAHLLVKLDARHAKYYFDYTGKKWGDAVNYDLCINSASYDIEESVE